MLSGGTAAAWAGQAVLRQGLVAGAWHTWQTWHTWDTAAVGADGGFRFAVTPTARAVDTYRVLLPATAQHGTAGRSAVRLTVRERRAGAGQSRSSSRTRSARKTEATLAGSPQESTAGGCSRS